MWESSKRKKKVYIKIAICYLIFAILFTGMLIYLNRKYGINVIRYFDNNQISQEDNTNTVSNNVENDMYFSKEKKVKLTDKYPINNLKIIDKEEGIGETLYIDEYSNKEVKKINLEYVEISGLKDKKNQDKINSEIYEEVVSEYKKYENNGKVVRISVYANVEANFSDVLCISIYTIVDIDNPENPTEPSQIANGIFYNEIITNSKGLNYILSTGTKLEFNDLFTSDASIKQIIAKSAYENEALSYYYDENFISQNPNFDGNMDSVDYSNIDDLVLNIVSKYNQNNNIDFTFNPNNITANIGKNTISINIPENIENIAIFNKYLSEKSLYEDGNLKAKDYVGKYPVSDIAYIYDEINENLFLNIYTNNEESEENKLKTNKFADKVKEKLELEVNFDKFYIYNLYFSYSDEEINVSGEEYEIEKEYYDEYKDEILSLLTRNSDLIMSITENELLFNPDKVVSYYISSIKLENNDIKIEKEESELNLKSRIIGTFDSSKIKEILDEENSLDESNENNEIVNEISNDVNTEIINTVENNIVDNQINTEIANQISNEISEIDNTNVSEETDINIVDIIDSRYYE